MAAKVSIRLQVIRDGDAYNWSILHVIEAYGMRGPGGFKSPEEAIRAVPAISQPDYLIPHLETYPSPLIN